MERAAPSAAAPSAEVVHPPAAVAVQGPAAAGAQLAGAPIVPTLQGGRPLPPSTRARLEASFGVPLDGVRVHDDAQADALSAEHQALAFTVGDHIAFSAGRYAPGTPSGDHLLAHEVAHVVQQRGGGGGVVEEGGATSRPGEAVKRQAEAAASAGAGAGAGSAAGLGLDAGPGSDDSGTADEGAGAVGSVGSGAVEGSDEGKAVGSGAA